MLSEQQRNNVEIINSQEWQIRFGVKPRQEPKKVSAEKLRELALRRACEDIVTAKQIKKDCSLPFDD